MILASLDRITKGYSTRPLLREVSLVVKSGDRIGLVGRNGVGKTTLIEILAGLRDPDCGSVSLSKEAKIAYLKQEPSFAEDKTLYQEMETPFAQLIALEARIEAVEKRFSSGQSDPGLRREYETLLDQRENWGARSYQSRIRAVTTGLGFSEEELSKQTKHLSGGERNRAALAQILLTDANLLLLDEPTNHLDICGREFLEDFLLGFKGGALIVSHDRYLLTRVATHIAELHAAKLKLYRGNYQDYLSQREADLERRKKRYEEQQEFIKRQEDFIRRNLAGQKSRQAQSRRRMLERPQRIEKPTELRRGMKLGVPETRRLPRKVVELKQIAKSYDRNPVFREVSITIERGDKVGLIGPNGCGKTTLLKLMLQTESPDSGEVLVGDNVVFGYYPQEVSFPDPSQRLSDYLWEEVPDWTRGQIHTYLGRFLFTGEEVKRPLESFSGGEQSKALLARLLLKNANFLVFDEPTNHLDIPSTEVLEEFLADFAGTLLAVSHDRYFLDKFTNKILAFEGNLVKEYLGNYSDYLSRGAAEKTTLEELPCLRGEGATAESQKPKGKRKPKSGRPREKRGTFKAQQIEKEIETLEGELQQIEEALESQTHSTDWAKLTSLAKERTALEKKLEELFGRWEKLTE